MGDASLEQIGGELSLIRNGNMECDWNAALHFCRIKYGGDSAEYQPTSEDNLLYDVFLKGLQRGRRPFPSYFTEQQIVSLYGAHFSIEENPDQEKGSITYSYKPDLVGAYKNFTDIMDPWEGNPSDVRFDPENPDNERELFRRLIDRFGKELGHCAEPQIDIASILAPQTADGFSGQRADLLLSFPNGKGLLLEPGDHDDDAQINLDERRDTAFKEIEIETLRPRNLEIRNEKLYTDIQEHFSRLDVERFLTTQTKKSDALLSTNYLFLLPSLIARVERLLLHFFFRRGLVHQKELRIGIIERDLECAELSIASFSERLENLSRLYGISFKFPSIQLHIQGNPTYRFGAIEKNKMPVVSSVERHTSLPDRNLDIVLDVGIKCNSLTQVGYSSAPHVGSARQCFPHNKPVHFSYCAQARDIKSGDSTDELLSTFVRDYFRKKKLRPGQGAIIRNILLQRPTIGLLPTSAGKSLCYQLASLLTPGTTIIVVPLIALMQDQVQGLKESLGIERALAWHAGAQLHDQDASALLRENIMIFISPERLQRPAFREAMQSLAAIGGIYINYAVVDEAHCVSMWGHDFRPAYLSLERNIRKFCTVHERPPVLVALTGTASQLVLIDLKRELDIQDFEAIIRPSTFDRPELNFSLVACPEAGKWEMMKKITAEIAQCLKVKQIEDAHGIIFSYKPREVWGLFGKYIHNAEEHVRTVLKGAGEYLHCGFYTGKPPKGRGRPLFRSSDWERYKKLTLEAFKRGQIQMMFGNTAISVGVDNERLNYVINYRMPQSMEAYYQQCGRAGRDGQHSECFLLFSDDWPEETQKWLDKETPQMRRRPDDLGIITYFHENSFPGLETDGHAVKRVFRQILREPGIGEGSVEIKKSSDNTERYISYLTILGILDDYEVRGMAPTFFRVFPHKAVRQFLEDGREAALKKHIIDSLCGYLSRYRPISRANIEKEIDDVDERLSSRCIKYLLKFIYGQIEYQQREAIRTMVVFCNEEDRSPERLRARIKAYFDESPKFSRKLLAMREGLPAISRVVELLDKIEGFDDVERLYWETRRLLDESPRPDWAAINLYTIAYREGAVVSNAFRRLFKEMMGGLRDYPQIDQEASASFLGQYLNCLAKIGNEFDIEKSGALLAECFAGLYSEYRLEYLPLIDEMEVESNVREYLHAHIAVKQLGEIINAKFSRITE